MELFNFEDGGLSRDPEPSPAPGQDLHLVTSQVAIEAPPQEGTDHTATSAGAIDAADMAPASTEMVSSEPQDISESLESDMRAATAISVPCPGLELSPMRAAQSAVRRLRHSTHTPWVSSADFECAQQVLGPFELPKDFSEYIIKAVRVNHRPRISNRFLKDAAGATHVISVLRTATGRLVLGHEPCRLNDVGLKETIPIPDEPSRPMLLITVYVRVGRRDVTTPQDFPHILDTKTPVVIGTDYWMLQGPYLVRVVNAPRKSLFLPTETEYLGPQKLKPLRIHELYNLDERNCIVSADTIRDNWIGRGSRGKAYAKRDHTSSWIGRVFFSDKGDYGKVLHLIMRANWW